MGLDEGTAGSAEDRELVATDMPELLALLGSLEAALQKEQVICDRTLHRGLRAAALAVLDWLASNGLASSSQRDRAVVLRRDLDDDEYGEWLERQSAARATIAESTGCLAT